MKPILLIDDDPDDQELMLGICRELRPERPVRSFENGWDALRYLQDTTEKPFLIFCDLNMPRMTGIELLRVIQQTPSLRQKSIPFICFSTANDPQYVQTAYDLGVQGFFQKPVTIDDYQRIFQLTFAFWEACLHPRDPSFVRP